MAITQAAMNHAAANHWSVTICVVDAGAQVLTLHRMDGADPGTVAVAEGKARSAALFRGPTRDLANRLGAGELGLLRLPDGMPMQGAMPIVVEGEVIGAVGVSGVASADDEAIATVAIEAVFGDQSGS
ncbi:hypothetical protein HKCCE4037_06665 [Rhodobacterales bacterium HKCCE4037]|nr:hypothetical protein [Rhodobacterales bacterium HKCCE4037]